MYWFTVEIHQVFIKNRCLPGMLSYYPLKINSLKTGNFDWLFIVRRRFSIIVGVYIIISINMLCTKWLVTSNISFIYLKSYSAYNKPSSWSNWFYLYKNPSIKSNKCNRQSINCVLRMESKVNASLQLFWLFCSTKRNYSVIVVVHCV